MGCKVQIHEKSDNRGTWAYHSVDGWYLNTSSEHYRTHNCHVKATRSERLSDTVQFQHKDITDPTVTHADKLVNAIATCINAIRSLGNGKNESDISDLNQLLEATSCIVKRNEDKATEEATDPSSTNLTEERDGDKDNDQATDPSSESADEYSAPPNPFRRVTRSMQRIQKALGVPRVDRIRETIGVPRVDILTQATEATPPSPRVNDSSPATPKSAAPVEISKTTPRRSAKKERASKAKAQRIKTASSPPKPTPATVTDNVAKTPPSLPSNGNSPAMNTRSKSGPPSANTRSSKPQPLPTIAMAVEEIQRPGRKRQSKQACRLAKRIAQVKSKF